MSINMLLGYRFDDTHQAAILLERYLGRRQAEAVAQQNGWSQIVQALNEQDAIVTKVT